MAKPCRRLSTVTKTDKKASVLPDADAIAVDHNRRREIIAQATYSFLRQRAAGMPSRLGEPGSILGPAGRQRLRRLAGGGAGPRYLPTLREGASAGQGSGQSRRQPSNRGRQD